MINCVLDSGYSKIVCLNQDQKFSEQLSQILNITHKRKSYIFKQKDKHFQESQENHINNPTMQRRQTEIIPGTDPNLVGQLQQQYYNVLKILIDPQLQPLKSRITMLYTSLTEHLQHEQNHIKKCKMTKDQIDGFVTRITSCNRMIEEETVHADTIKKDLEKLQSETDQLKKKQSDVNHRISRQMLEMRQIENEQRKKLDEIQILHQNQETDLKKKLDEQNKISDQLQTKTVSLLKQQDYGMSEMSQLDKKRFEVNQRIDDLNKKIQEIQKKDKHEKINNQTKKNQLNLAKQQKDQLKNKKLEIQDRITKLDRLILQTTERLKQSKKEKDEAHREKKKEEKEKERVQKEYKRKEQEKLKAEISLAESKEQLKKFLMDEEEVNKNRKELEKEKEMITKKLNQLKAETQKLQADKERIARTKQIQNEKLERLISQRDRNKSQISALNSKKMEVDKLCKVNESKEHEIYEQNIEEMNKYKKIKNECNSYQIEQERLAKILEQIKKQQQKYGIEASHAHSKYYQILEELRLKNTQIQNLQRQNQQVENKCKHQQNLYEAVRSDRNLYSKDFLRSKEEISDLKKKYKRMTFQVEQLRDQIKAKDQELVELDKQYKKVEAQNVKIKADKNRAKAQIQSTEEVIKNQENHIGHLKKIIQQAKQQKAKQQKDYDMVRNERDILGTQLIKRNQQLAVLYEKIKLSNSNLTKGQIYYKEKQKDFNNFRADLANKRNEFMSIEEQIRSIDQLKAEISFKEKDLLNQQAKVKALQDELQNPMNVHRWRKLQATDQDNYERILKIQTLQRRLIAKTEEVEAKQNLIREKQKLFLELKNILARQPGAQIHDQLIKYKEALKQKTAQMKKMKKQLEDAHEQMGRVKYDVDRIRNEMYKMKQEYFELREASEKQVMDERNFAQEMMNLNSNEVKLGGQFMGNLGGMQINAVKK